MFGPSLTQRSLVSPNISHFALPRAWHPTCPKSLGSVFSAREHKDGSITCSHHGT